MSSEGQVPAEALSALGRVLERTREGEDPEIDGIVKAREEVLERYRAIFSRDHLSEITEEEFRSFLDYDNNQHWRNIHRHKSRLTEDMDTLRGALLTLTDEDRSITDRLTELRPPDGSPKVDYLGKAVITPILLVHRPEKYGVWNSISQSGMKQLGLWPEGADESRFAESYAQVNRVLTEVAAELDLDLWTLDALWWRVEDLEEPQRKEPRVWWVNQGDNYEIEKSGGFIWATQKTRGGNPVHHHDNVQKVEAGDVLIHYAKKKIRALGRAIRDGEERGRPESFSEDDRVSEGYAVDVEYFELSNPVAFGEIPEEWRIKSEGPFHSEGRVQLGYCFQVEHQLASNIRQRFSDRWPPESPWGQIDVTESTPVRALDWLQKKTLWKRSRLKELVEDLEGSSPQVVLAGPPGTSKTWVAKHVARYLTDDQGDRHRTVQFHPSYGYEDFIEGLRPVSDDGSISFNEEKGVLLQMTKEMRDSGREDETHVLVIDEMNRANLPRVFGELMYLFEYRGEGEEIQLQYTDNFSLPKGLKFIATMNTADRSIRSIDIALRRRFDVFECMPEADVIRQYYAQEEHKNEVEGLIDGFEALNNQLREEIDKHHQIGHTFFMEPAMDSVQLRKIWDRKLDPLIEEYFFDQPDIAAEYTLEEFWPEV